MQPVWKDVVYAWRILRNRPSLSTVALMTFTLGIGANSAVFTVVDTCLLRPLPIKDPDSLYVLFESNPQKDLPRAPTSALNFADWRQQSRSFAQIEAFSPADLTLTGAGEPQRLRGMRTTAHYLALAVQPVIGRLFTPDDDRPGAPPVLILGDGFWKRRFGSDPGILGRPLTLDGTPHVVVGVAPSMFESEDEVWIPLAIDREASSRGARLLIAVGRLKTGVTPQQAQIEMNTIASRLTQQFPETNTGWGVTLLPLKEQVVENLRPLLQTLFAAVGVVLLLACANVASLELTRTASRDREIAIQTALGARRRRLILQLLTASLLLALTGGLLGVLVAIGTTKVLLALNTGRVPLLNEAAVDGRILLFTLVISLLAGLLSGLIPAVYASRADLGEVLKGGGKGLSHLRRRRLLRAIVSAELALSIVLLTGAGLLLKSFAQLQNVDLGFEPAGMITGKLALPATKYGQQADRAVFLRRLLHDLQALPGVEAAASVHPMPVTGVNSRRPVAIEGQVTPGAEERPQVSFRIVSPDYFRTMRIPLLEGRAFTERDDAESALVVIVNETLARRFFSGASPLGRRLTFDNPATGEVRWRTIVGVVGGVRFNGPASEFDLEMYYPAFQDSALAATLVARSSLPAENLSEPLRKAVLAVDPDLPLYEIRTSEQIVAGSIVGQKLSVLLFGLFAALALLLACIGVYGLTRHSVTLRTSEIGLRIALGAPRTNVVRLVVWQSMAPVLVGLVLGLGVSLLVTRFLSRMLHGVNATDPLVLAAAAMALIGMGLLASSFAARRAAEVDPVRSLRAE